ncbi:hypothetical protein AN958_11607 [Leucoagaricus sp. SymC.cos]|nr:hypothetical protein AN958_11607 [Leucoagaricus sp. SymC.cos]
MEIFERLAGECKQRNGEGLPPLYQDGMFWFPTTAPFFILCSKSNVSPPELYIPQFFLWDPIAFEKIPCPNCKRPLTPMSKRLFEFMRSCFQNGIGSKQFADMLRVQHLLAHDHLKLQYLNHVAHYQESLDRWSGKKFEPFPDFDDTSPNGRHGYTPSSEWLRNMYDSYIELHKKEINQHMSMLTGEVCSIDHSHKVCSQAHGPLSLSCSNSQC